MAAPERPRCGRGLSLCCGVWSSAVRNDVYRCIRATDITRHGEFIASVAALAQNPVEVGTTLAMELTIKCADICNAQAFPDNSTLGVSTPPSCLTTLANPPPPPRSLQGDAEKWFAIHQ